jgi:hypothetical protein
VHLVSTSYKVLLQFLTQILSSPHTHLYTGFTAFTRFHDLLALYTLIPTYLIPNPTIKMRSFAVIGFAASASAMAYGYPEAVNSTSVAAPVYGASTPAGYPVSTPAAYPVSSEAPKYETKTVTGLTTVCPGSTTLTVGTKTYTVTKSTTIIDEDCEYTTTIPVKPTPAPGKPSAVPAYPSSIPAVGTPNVPYPSKNVTIPTYPAGTAAPSSTKPSPSQFTGAAAQSGAAFLAIAGALAAFL